MPSRPADAVFINQVTWRLAAVIAAGAALVAVLLTTSRQRAAGADPGSDQGAVVEPAPHVADIPVGVDVSRCIEFCARHVTAQRSFVVFANGSCVIVNEPSTEPVVAALRTLEECASPNARFITRQIEDGHHLVTYRYPVFHCLFAEEISPNRSRVEREFFRYLSAAERKGLAPGFDPPFHAKLGLVARARLNQDAAEPLVKKIIRAKPAENGEPTPGPELGSARGSVVPASGSERTPPDSGEFVSPPPEPPLPASNGLPAGPLRIVPPYLPEATLDAQ